MKKFVKYLIGIILFVVIGTLGQMFRSYLDSSSKPSKSSAIQQLKKVSNDLNKECPTTFNEFTTLVSVQFGTNPIPNKREFDTSTHYTEYTYKIPAMLNEEEIAIQRDKMVNEFCSDPVYDFYIENDFAMHYTYVSDDDTYSSITIPVSKYDCKGLIVSKLNLQEDDKVKSSSAKASSIAYEEKFIDEWEVIIIREHGIMKDMSWIINDDKTIIISFDGKTDKNAKGIQTNQWTINNKAKKFIVFWDENETLIFNFEFINDNKVCLEPKDKPEITLEKCNYYLKRK